MTQHITVPLEIKALNERELEGHGSVFGNVDLGGDIVMPGAFKRSLAAHRKAGTMPQMFWMHQPDQVPGAWREMSEDATGLALKGELAQTQLGNEMRTLAQMKAVRGLSIGYQIKDADFDNDGNRLLKEIDLWEVSLVSLAMNPLARIDAAKSRLSSAGEYIPTEREFERSLRSAGCSKNVARTLIAKIFDGGEAGGMPVEPRWDADDIDAEAKAILEVLETSSAMLVRDALNR